MRRGRRWKLLGIADALAFHNSVNGVCGDILERFGFAVWPANFDGVHFCRRAETKMQAQVVLREITSAAMDFAELLNTCRADGHAGADRSAIAFCADQIKQGAMVAIGIHVLEQRASLTNVEDDDVDIAVIEDIAEGCAAAALHGQSGESRSLGDFVEGAISIVAMEQHRLPVACSGFDRVDLREDMAVGNKDVEPGIVVHVEEARTPANQAIILLPKAGSPAHILESLGAEILVEPVGLLGEMGDEET